MFLGRRETSCVLMNLTVSSRNISVDYTCLVAANKVQLTSA